MEFQTTSYVCRYCKGSFDHVENLQKHVEQIHTPRPTKDKFKFCPLCGLRCAKYETYRDHLKHIHRLSEEGKVFVLKCFNDFHVWKNELEKRMYCKYNQQGQPKLTQFSKDKIYVYRCDSSSSSTKEKKKSSWAAKDTCPSTISAIENVTNHTVKVEHWNTHVGHSIPIEGEELDAAIGSLQTTEIIIDEQSYQSSDHDSQSGLFFLAENNDGSISETLVKETNKKQPPSLFKNNGNPSSLSMPRKFSFKKDPNKKSVSFSGSLASVACMKATVKKDPTTSGGKVTIDTKSSTAMSSVVDSAYTKFVSDAKNVKSSTPIKTNSNLQRSGNAAVRQLAPKPSETLKSNLKNVAKDEKSSGQFLLLNSLQGPNGQQSFILCPVDGALPSSVQTKNSDSKATPCKEGEPPQAGKSSVSADKETSAANVQDLKNTDPEKADVSAKSDSAEKSDNEVVDAVPPEISVESNEEKEKSSTSEEVTETVVNTSEDVPCSDSTKNVSLPLVSILKNKSGSTDETNASLDSAKTPKQVKKRAPRKQKLAVGDKASPVTSSTTTPNAIGTILRNNLTGQQIMVPMNLLPGLTNINSPMSKPGSIPMPVAGNVLGNSLTPGMTYIQINNTLIPISTPGGPNLNSNFIINTPVSTSSNPQTSQPVISFSALTQPSTAKTLVVNTPTTSVAGPVPGNALNKAPNNNLSVFVLPQTGGKSATSMPMIPISGVQAQNIGKPVTSGQTSKPKQIVNNSPRLQNSGNTRPPLIQNNAQFVPPRLLAVAQLCQRLNTPGSPGLTPIRGLGPAAPKASQTVQLPVPLSTTCPLPKATSTSGSVNSVAANSGPISSTTEISIPSNPIPHPQKPGSFIFESSGDFFVLEPIEDSKLVKSVLPAEQSKNLKSGAPKSPKVQSKAKANVIARRDTVRSPLKSSPKYPVPDSPKEDIKIEVKLPKPRNYSRFYDGKKVSTLAQKRLFKEEDSDILQKVKYYNLEMKYLTSQAECKRLKLELAKSNMKKKESVETVPITLNNTSLEESVPDELIIDQLTKNLLNKIEEDEAITKIRTEKDSAMDLNDNKPTEIETNEEPMDYEDIDNEIQVDQSKEVTNSVAEEGLDVHNKESEDKIEIHENSDTPIDNTESHNSLIDNDDEIQVDQPKEVTNTVSEESLGVHNKECEDKIEIHEDSDMPIDNTESNNPLIGNDNIPEQSLDSSQAENQSMLNEVPVSSINISGTLRNSDIPIDNTESPNPLIDNDNIPEQSVDTSQAENQSMLNEIPVSSANISGTMDDVAQNQELVNECLDSFERQQEITSISENETCKILIDQNVIMDDKSEDLREQVTDTEDIEHNQHDLKDVQHFDEEKPCEKPETDNIPFEDQSAQQTLKDLEMKYGEQDLDVYTMIRTSVLRSLYADMQDLCEQNKKLFEELQSLKSNEETYEVIVQEAPTEQL